MMTNTANLPRDLTDNGLFCCWRLEDRGKHKTKIPYNAHTGGMAQSNNPDTFAPFDKALAAQGRYDGLGVGIFNGISAIDIDHCVNDDGTLAPLAQDVVDRFRDAGAYVEYSPSGTGVRILFRAPGFQYDTDAYYINRQKIGLEVYVFGATKKYVTVTGNAIQQTDTLPDCTAQLQAILDKYMKRDRKKAPPAASTKDTPPAQAAPLSDQKVIDKAKAAKNGARFTALWGGDYSAYNSPSEGDQALCNYLAYWCNDDAAQMDRLFRQSGLMRHEKWDRPQSGSTYGAITIAEAINSPHSVYNPIEFVKRRAEAVMIHKIEVGKLLAELKPEKSDRYSWSDMGNGYLFADIFKNVARYVPERKKWFIYDGRRWAQDVGDLRAMALCKKLADALVLYALSVQDAGGQDDYFKFTQTWRKRNRRETIIKDAASVYPVSIEEFDQDPYVFNCLNGTLNLKTGEFNAHTPEDWLSKVSGVAYDPDARCERWERFIDEVMQGDTEKATFLQKAMGYALTGDTHYECFFILFGPKSRNGKGTSMETFMTLMGDYGKSAKPDTIAQKQQANGSGPSEDIARLAGARFVNISEPDQRLVLSAALVKTLTGNDTITARYLHENSFEYKPQFKLFINTNHLPKVTDVTLFSSGRVKLIPFERHFTPEEQDGGLKTELSKPENLSGILNWCIEGSLMIDVEGFDAPESVKAATDEYRANSDKLGRFLADEMIEDVNGEVRTVSAYQRFTKWCEENGFKPENASNFKQMMENIAEVRMKRPAGSNRSVAPTNFIIGYRLRYDDFVKTNERSPWGGARAFSEGQNVL